MTIALRQMSEGGLVRRWLLGRMGSKVTDARARRPSESAAGLERGDLLFAPRDRGSVVLHIPSGSYLELDDSATTILRLVNERGREGATAELVRQFGIDDAVARADVATVIETIVGAQSHPVRPLRRPKVTGAVDVFRKWLRMDGNAKLAVVGMSVVVLGVEVAIRMRPVDEIARTIGVPVNSSPVDLAEGRGELDYSGLTSKEVLRLDALEWVLRHWITDATCLRQALASGWVLRSHQPRLQIGLTDQDDVIAHAWIVVDGATLGALGGLRGFRSLPGVEDHPGHT